MAGTDSSRRGDADTIDASGAPAVVLVEPQLGQNIGMAARAMLNCGLTDLRLVNPRDGWPSEPARAAASGADLVIDQARVYATAAEAVADLNLVIATTARSRDMTKRVVTPRRAAEEIRQIHAESGARTGILFGREAKGLDNDEVALADAILNVPLNPAFSSLNLAQAVLLVGYEWRLTGLDVPAEDLAMPKTTRPADHQDLVHLFEHLEQELETCGFLQPPERAPTMVRNLRNLFGRARLTDQEVRILRGVIVALRRGPKDPANQD
ncbi:RNA methyltransferase [Thalassospiraceae bacterium LMO-SO8]|nr:RNA methyltransferase [Alphaproteobacteria bacterium LMO-S08]WND77976.1 RNA methyltransferase [Thalassospiraceae bacterium LMO-SO8]